MVRSGKRDLQASHVFSVSLPLYRGEDLGRALDFFSVDRCVVGTGNATRNGERYREF